MSRIESIATAAFSLFLCLHGATAPAEGAEIGLTGGDKVTGRIVRLADGAVTLATESLGKLAIDVGDIATIDAGEPITVELEDGTRIVGSLTSGAAAGTVAIQPGTGAVRTVAWDDIAWIVSPWTGSVGASAQHHDGTGDAVTGGLEIDLGRDTARDLLSLSFDFSLVEGESVDLVQKGSVSIQYDRHFAERWYAFGTLDGYHDDSAHLDLRSTVLAGAGYVFFDEKYVGLEVDVGAGYEREDLDGFVDEDRAVGRLHVKGKAPVSRRAVVKEELKAYPSLEDDELKVRNEISLEIELSGAWSVELSHTLSYDRDPLPGTESTDSHWDLGLKWTL